MLSFPCQTMSERAKNWTAGYLWVEEVEYDIKISCSCSLSSTKWLHALKYVSEINIYKNKSLITNEDQVNVGKGQRERLP